MDYLSYVILQFENKEKVKIKNFDNFEELNVQSKNNLYFLNKALSLGGFDLEISENYKCKKPIIIYNYFTSNLNNKIINSSNKIKLNQNSELTLIEYNSCEKNKFIKNTFEEIDIAKDAILKSFNIQKLKNNGFFYRKYLDLKIITQVTKILY